MYFLVDCKVENTQYLCTLCECLGGDWHCLANSKYKVVKVPNEGPVINLFEVLDGTIFAIVKKEED